ncbi:MAG TPA: flagellar motor switch protein FliN [Paenalcaligenes sp.]|nr:flagellar motor switch protein FliN [Paenalcaligenes sp.]
MTNPKNERHTKDTPNDTQDELDINWEEALAEQAQGSSQAQNDGHAETTQDNADSIFQPLEQNPEVSPSDIDMIMDIPVQLSVELGRTRLTIKNILQLGQGSVVELDGLAGEPMDVYVNGYLIAQGEVVVVDDKYGIRITDIITPSDRIHRLNTR